MNPKVIQRLYKEVQSLKDEPLEGTPGSSSFEPLFLALQLLTYRHRGVHGGRQPERDLRGDQRTR
jgi:hypothetical protein